LMTRVSQPHGFWVQGLADFEEVKYINYGLLRHKKRSGGLMGTEDIFDKFCNFGQNSRDLLKTVPDFCKDSVYTEYIREFGSIAKKCNIKIPWFVPQSFGGVGLQPHSKWQPSRKDRCVCSLIRKDNFRFPLLGKDQMWKVHKSVERMFDSVERIEDSTLYDEFYTYGCLSVYFDAVLSSDYSTVYSDGSARDTVKVLRSAERVWAKLLPRIDNREIDPWLLEPRLFPVFFTTS